MKLPLIIFLSIVSNTLFGQSDTVASHAIKFTAIEKQGKLPQLFAERRGVLFSFANRGDSLLENRSLGLAIKMPRGFSTEILEPWIKKEILLAKHDIEDFKMIKTIYFDFNSALIRNDASAQLDKMATLMLRYPFAKIEVIVHTDSRGSQSYNRKLAAKRGESIMKYLSGSGANMELLKVIVSGEEALSNDCLNQVDCDEIIHQLNRRAEFNFDPRIE